MEFRKNPLGAVIIDKHLCLDGKEREIRMSKDYQGNFHYSYTVYKNGKLFGASHGAYKLNPKMFSKEFENEMKSIFES